MKEKYRIVKFNDVLKMDRELYSIQERCKFLGLFPYWKLVYYYRDEERFRSGIRDYAFFSLKDAKSYLEWYKKTNAEVVYSE